MATKIKEKDIQLANNTTNDVSTSQHGFHPKLPNDANQTLGGDGNFTVIDAATVGKTWAISKGYALP